MLFSHIQSLCDRRMHFRIANITFILFSFRFKTAVGAGPHKPVLLDPESMCTCMQRHVDPNNDSPDSPDHMWMDLAGCGKHFLVCLTSCGTPGGLIGTARGGFRCQRPLGAMQCLTSIVLGRRVHDLRTHSKRPSGRDPTNRSCWTRNRCAHACNDTLTQTTIVRTHQTTCGWTSLGAGKISCMRDLSNTQGARSSPLSIAHPTVVNCGACKYVPCLLGPLHTATSQTDNKFLLHVPPHGVWWIRTVVVRVDVSLRACQRQFRVQQDRFVRSRPDSRFESE